MNQSFITLLFWTALTGVACAQPSDQPCSKVVATFPAAMNQEVIPLNHRQRFELRECDSGAIQVFAFEKNRKTPVLFVDINGPWPRQLVHVYNILAVQNVGGSSSNVFIMRFHHGKIQPLVVADTRGEMKTQVVDDGRYMSIVVPPDKRITSPGATRRFRFRVECVENDPDVP